MSETCLLLKTGPAQAAPIWLEPPLAARVDVVDQYALRDLEWRHYAGLIVPMHTDQRWFAELTNRIEAFLSGGGAIAFNGHVAYPFLPELRPFVPMSHPRPEDLIVETRCSHPVFAGFDPASMNSRRGVSGFWGRGHNPPPEGAVVLQSLRRGTIPIDWFYERGDRGGRLLVHSGNDLWTNFEAREDNLRIARQLVDWLCGNADAAMGAS